MGVIIRNGVVYAGVIVDDTLSTESTNPVQNKVITNALNTKQDKLIFDTRFNFPVDGNPLTLYIATDENAIYRYEEGQYVRISSDWQNINIIDGGDSNG